MASSRDTQSRADRIRQQRRTRKQKSVKTQQQAPPPQAEYRSLPPVMVRGGDGAQSQAVRNPRRRYDISLGTPGAEMRLPSVPIVKPGWRIVSSVLVMLMVGTLYYLLTAPEFRINAVELQGTQRLTSQDMNKTLYGLLGKTIFEVEPAEIEETIMVQYPDLVDVTAEVGLPAKLSIAARERQPVITWVMPDATYWVDATGIAFPVRDTTLELPIVQAETQPYVPVEVVEEVEVQGDAEEPGELPALVDEYQPEKFMDPSMVTAVKKLASYAPPGVIFVYQEERGFGWQAEQGWQVYFGLDVQDIDMKLTVYDSVVDHLVAENIQPALVDMEFVHAPYYRMER